MNLLCPDSVPSLFGIFDFSIAPSLLFYSYIPIVLVSILFAFYLLQKDHSLMSRLIFGIALSFSLWVLNILFQWVASPAAIVHFAWEITAVFEVLIFTFSLYFCFVFVNEGRDISYGKKALLYTPLVLVALFLPTTFNVTSFDLQNCQSIIGNLWMFIYGYEILSVFIVVGYGIYKIRKFRKDSVRAKEIKFIVSGIALFLTVFSLSNIYGQVSGIYEVNLIGPIGMVIFLVLLTYSIIKFKTFDLKVFSVQVLVLAILVLVGSQFFFIQNNTNRIITGVTVLLVCVFGYQLVKSVKREIEAKERVQKLAIDLQSANTRLLELDKQKTEFISFATHQLRSPLTAIKGNASLILEGDMGPVPERVRGGIDTIYTSIKTMINIVEDYLNVSRIELGTMQYNMTPLDFKDILKEVITEQKTNIEAKGLAYYISVDENDTYPITVDSDKFKQVIINTIDNSIKYTSTGSLTVRLTKDPVRHVVRLTIADTGVGIAPEVMPKLFQKFSRAKDASASNIHGTGLGLFIGKEIMIAHRGKIWAESEGEGKGSQFYIEVPERTTHEHTN